MTSSALSLPPARRRRPTLGRIAAWAALLAMLSLTLLPLWMVIKTALMQPADCSPSRRPCCRSRRRC